MPSYCRVFAECVFKKDFKKAESLVNKGFLVAEAGFEPATFGNGVPTYSKQVSNTRKKPILWAYKPKKQSKAAISLASKCQSNLNKNLTFIAELLPSRSISKKNLFTKKITQKFNNGTEIYEGDIVKMGDDIATIVFEEGSFKAHVKNSEIKTSSYYWSCIGERFDFKVIGNIHASKLKEQQQ